MTKVPPKIQPGPNRPRPKRVDDARPRRVGQTDEDLDAEMKTLGEQLEEARIGLEEHAEWAGLESSEEKLGDAEEKKQDEEAFAKAQREKESPLKRKGASAQQGNGSQNRPHEEHRPELPGQRAGGLKDGFDGGSQLQRASSSQGAGALNRPALGTGPSTMAPISAPPPPAPRMGGGGFGAAMKFLNDAKEAGFYFRMGQGGGKGAGAEAETEEALEEAELRAAVEEARQQLGALRGVTQIEGGRDHEEERVVFILAGKGFCESSMAAIPENVHRFRTVVGVPYELLPLRRI